MCVCVYYEALAHTTVETVKSHDLPSASWRSGTANSVVQSESEGLKSRKADGVSPSPRAGEGEMNCPSSGSEAGKKG